jgi:hypothetical protein
MPKFVGFDDTTYFTLGIGAILSAIFAILSGLSVCGELVLTK